MALTGLLLSGCVLRREEFRTVALHDVAVTVPAAAVVAQPLPLSIHVTRLRTVAPAGTRMLYRLADRRLVQDEYHRWVQRPEDMLTRELYRGFLATGTFRRVEPPDATADTDLRLSGTLIALECDHTGHAVVELAVSVLDTRQGLTVLGRAYQEREPLAPVTPDGFAAAASVALSRILQAVAAHVAGLDAAAK